LTVLSARSTQCEIEILNLPKENNLDLRIRMTDIFIWFAGGEHRLLEKCTNVERRKFAMYGALILIPTTLAFISMSYALSTFVEDKRVIYTCGTLWALAVFIIDRFIVSTTFKSGLFSWGNAMRFFVRFLFAIILGVTISHPVVMLFFDDVIAKQIRAEHENNLLKEENALLGERNENNELISERNRLNSLLDCNRKLLTAEYSGKYVSLPCGESSGLRTCGKRCDILRGEISKIESSIQSVSKSIVLYDDNTEAQIERLRNSKIESYDYISRVEILGEIEEDSPHVWYARIFLMFLFITIDVIPVVFKATAIKTEYDDIVIKKRDNKHAAFQKEIVSEQQNHDDLQNRMFEWKKEKFKAIFTQMKSRSTKELIKALKNELGIKLDDSLTGVEKEENPVFGVGQEDSQKKSPFSLRDSLSNPITYIFFALAFFVLSYYLLTNYFLENQESKEQQAIMIALLGLVGGLISQMAPNFQKSKK